MKLLQRYIIQPRSKSLLLNFAMRFTGLCFVKPFKVYDYRYEVEAPFHVN